MERPSSHPKAVGAKWPHSTLGVLEGPQLLPQLTLHLETIVSRVSKKLDGKLAYSGDSYRTIGTSEGHIDIIRKGYKPTWDKHAPRQRVAPSNPTISTKASNIFDTDVAGLLEKGAICELGPVQRQYVGTYFPVPKSKRNTY